MDIDSNLESFSEEQNENELPEPARADELGRNVIGGNDEDEIDAFAFSTIHEFHLNIGGQSQKQR